MSRLEILRARFHQIRCEKGLPGLLKASVLYLISPIYERNIFYLYKYDLNADCHFNVDKPKANIQDLKFIVVSSNQEADELEKRNLKFRTCPTDFNDGLKTYTKWLEEGAIACCTFAGSDFAAIMWIILSQKTQDRIKTIPLKVNYSNHEAFIRGAWVNPEYRGKGLHIYTWSKRDSFLKSRGITTLRTTVDMINKPGLSLASSVGTRIYGRGRLVKFLFWRFWKETIDNE